MLLSQGNVIQAQMNEANFTGSLAKEMITMMDLAETAKQVIEPLSFLVCERRWVLWSIGVWIMIK
jgi:hypothetical protein